MPGCLRRWVFNAIGAGAGSYRTANTIWGLIPAVMLDMLRCPKGLKLPSLSAYLGHLNVIGTEVYLKATPQLLELASVRFEQHLRHSRQPR